MPTLTPAANRATGTRTVHTTRTHGQQQHYVNAILARTNWQQYWSNVSVQVEREVEAYDAARARSFATASRRFLR